MKRLVIAAILAATLVPVPAHAGQEGPTGPCRVKSWIPRTGMPVAEQRWRFIRLVRCATFKWWRGHASDVLAVAWRESHYNTYAVSSSGRYVGAFQHDRDAWPQRAVDRLNPDWFKSWPVPWWNARAQVIVTVRMMADVGTGCPGPWCYWKEG